MFFMLFYLLINGGINIFLIAYVAPYKYKFTDTHTHTHIYTGFPGGASGKEFTCQCSLDITDAGSIPGLGSFL